jgi:ABC-type oligopeptide transport system substrate-binding subunit
VRQALALAVDKDRIIAEVFENLAVPISSPIPPGSFGALDEGGTQFNISEARSILEKTAGLETPRPESTRSSKKRRLQRSSPFLSPPLTLQTW